jgi:hypothetical protein
MTRDDIIRMAREAGATNVDAADPQCWAGDIAFEEEELERFFHAAYAAGAKAEQDRCCKIVYGMAGSDNVAQRTVDAIRGNHDKG